MASTPGCECFRTWSTVLGMAGTTVDRAGRPGVLGKAPTVRSDRLGGVGAARSAGRCHQVDDAAKAGGKSGFCRTGLPRSVRLVAGSSMSFGGVNDRRRAIGVDVPRAAAERPIDKLPTFPALRQNARLTECRGRLSRCPGCSAMTALGNAALVNAVLVNALPVNSVNVVLVNAVSVNALAVILGSGRGAEPAWGQQRRCASGTGGALHGGAAEGSRRPYHSGAGGTGPVGGAPGPDADVAMDRWLGAPGGRSRVPIGRGSARDSRGDR